jgi:hypothetical protein
VSDTGAEVCQECEKTLKSVDVARFLGDPDRDAEAGRPTACFEERFVTRRVGMPA